MSHLKPSVVLLSFGTEPHVMFDYNIVLVIRKLLLWEK